MCKTSFVPDGPPAAIVPPAPPPALPTNSRPDAPTSGTTVEPKAKRPSGDHGGQRIELSRFSVGAATVIAVLIAVLAFMIGRDRSMWQRPQPAFAWMAPAGRARSTSPPRATAADAIAAQPVMPTAPAGRKASSGPGAPENEEGEARPDASAPSEQAEDEADIENESAPVDRVVEGSRSAPIAVIDHPEEPSIERYWTLGSSKKTVEEIEGPAKSVESYDALDEEIWRFGAGDRVMFSIRTGGVVKWDNESGRLRVAIAVDGEVAKADAQAVFNQGSTKADVLRAQGTPKSIEKYEALNEEIWRYNSTDRVTFNMQNDTVAKWENNSGMLRIGTPRPKDQPRRFRRRRGTDL